MSTFIKNIGKVRFNGYGADLYENKDGSASIRFDKNTHDLPMSSRLVFDSVEEAEEFIEENRGSDGLNTLVNILKFKGLI